MKRTQKVYIDFAAVKAALTITEVLSHYDLLNKFRQSSNADEWRSSCPLHGGDNSSEFSINTSKNVWNCFSECHRGGNILDFVSVKEQVDIHDAALLLNDWFDLGLAKSNTSGKPDPAPKKSRSKKKTKMTPSPENRDQPACNPPLGFELKDLVFDHPYLQEREIPPAMAESFGMGFCSRGSMAGRIAIPLHNVTGRLIGYLGRWPGEPPDDRPKYKLPTGFRKSLELYNFHRVLDYPPETPLIIVEGIFDVMALTRAGHPKCIALLGSSLSTAQEHLLTTNAYGTCPSLTLLLDEDEAGQRGREDALSRLAYHFHVKVVRFPLKGSQPDDLPSDQLEELLNWKSSRNTGSANRTATRSDREPCDTDVNRIDEGIV